MNLEKIFFNCIPNLEFEENYKIKSQYSIYYWQLTHIVPIQSYNRFERINKSPHISHADCKSIYER